MLWNRSSIYSEYFHDNHKISENIFEQILLHIFLTEGIKIELLWPAWKHDS